MVIIRSYQKWLNYELGIGLSRSGLRSSMQRDLIENCRQGSFLQILLWKADVETSITIEWHLEIRKIELFFILPGKLVNCW